MTNGKSLKHIAFIMDGNGRWAKARHESRTYGHEEGFKNLIQIVKACKSAGIQYVTCYAFSTENWKRPKEEVDFLMTVPEQIFVEGKDQFLEEEIKVTFIGRRDRIPKRTLKIIKQIEKETSHFTFQTIIAFDYGGRDEIVRAVNKMIQKEKHIDETIFSKYLDTCTIPDVDLLVRTSGEVRISNFLLWQIAYAEMFFTKTLWPDFSKDELQSILVEYNNRTRKFGKV